MVRTLPARGSGAAATTCPRGVRGVVDHPHGQLRSLATPLDDRLLLCLNLCGRPWVATVRPRWPLRLECCFEQCHLSDRSSWLRLPPLRLGGEEWFNRGVIKRTGYSGGHEHRVQGARGGLNQNDPQNTEHRTG